MDEEYDLEIAELLGYLRHRVEVWEDRASRCVSQYARGVCYDLAEQAKAVVEQIEIDRSNVEVVA